MEYCEFALSDEAKGFSWFPGDKFFNFIFFFLIFFLEIGSSVFVDLEKFQPDTLIVNFEVLKLHLCMYILLWSLL